MKTPPKTVKLKAVMSPMRMLKLFSATVVVGGFSVADVHAEWFCPKCNVKHKEAICPNETEMDRQRDNFGIWQPTWRCEACKAIHTPKQRWWWKDSKQPLVTCENGCWPCETCETVHSAEDTFTQNAWCCPTCRTQHTDGRLYCEQTHGFYTKKVWFCTSCNKPHGTYQPCESEWFCEKCKKGHRIGETCQTGRWYCSACQKSYKAKESCQHSWNCPSDGGCGKIHQFDEICPNGNMYCLSCKDVLLKANSCNHYWACSACDKHHAVAETCPKEYWFCIDCFQADPLKGVYAQDAGCSHYWWCADCNSNNGQRYAENKSCEHRWGCSVDKTGHAYNEACNAGYWYCVDCDGGTRYANGTQKLCEHTWYCPDCKYGHNNTDGSCETRWYCPNCDDEDKIHEVTGEQDYCEHSWYCTTCQKGHLLTEPCLNGYWYCKSCHEVYNSAGGSPTLSDDHSWYCFVNETNSGCKVGHLKTETCSKHYRWCNEECQQVYDPNTPCVHCWECPSCYKTYGPNAMCSTDKTWCCGCPSIQASDTNSCGLCTKWRCTDCNAVKDSTAVCAHRWFCATHQQLNTANEKCASGTCNIFGCKECGVKTSCCDHYWVCTKCYVLRDHNWISVLCPDCQTGWYCPNCRAVHVDEVDGKGNFRPSPLNNTLRLKGKKTLLKKQSLVNDRLRLNAFKQNHDPFAEVQSDGSHNGRREASVNRSFHSDGDQANQPILRATEKIIRKKNKQTRNDRKEDLKEKSKRSSSSSSSSSSSDKDKKLVINTRKKNGLKTDGMKLTIVKPMNFEFKSSSKSSNTDKYPLLTQSHIKYSEKKEEPKDPSPKHKKELSSNASSDEERKRTLEGKPSSPNVSPKSKHKEESASDSDTSKPTFTEKKKEGKKVLQSSKVERPVLQYNLNLDALTNNLKNEPLAASGLSDFEQAAEVKEKSRLDGLKLQLKQNSKMQTSSGPKKKIVPSLSKVIKGGERKKADRSDNKESKQEPTFKPSSSSSDSDASETPKETPKGSNVYTNNTPGAVRKSSKKIYREDEGNETPSNSQASSRFNLLKSPKNKHAAPNVSGAKPTSKKLPSASDSSQQIGLKTIEGPKKPTKEDTPKSKNKKQSDSEASKKSDEENKSDDDKYSSNDDKKSSHSKSSKSSSKKSAHACSHDNHSEKHSDGEGLKSDKESDKENKSSEHNESANAEDEDSEEEDELSKEEKELSEDSEK